MLLIPISVAIPAMLGFLSLELLWPRSHASPSGFSLRIPLAVGLGFGFSSVLLFFWLIIFGQFSKPFNWVLPGFLLFLIPLYYRFVLRNRRRSVRPKEAAHVNPQMGRILLFYFVFALLMALAISLSYFFADPHGKWDAWSHWNLRARFVFRGGEDWINALHPDYWNPLNYPFFIPMAVAATWGFIGKESVYTPGLIAMLFTFASVLLLASSLASLRSKGQGFLAAIVLMGTPFFLYQGNSQYADIPLSFFILAAFALAALYETAQIRSMRFLILAGVMAGLAGWTKNEGQLFILCFILIRFLGAAFEKGVREAFRELGWFGAGLLPVLALIVYVKTQVYPPQTIFQTRGLHYTTEMYWDLSRYRQIATAFFKTFFQFGNWSLSLPLIMVVYLFGMKVQSKGKTRSMGGSTLLILALMLFGYYLVYLSAPHNLEWLLRTSVDRLFVTLWPAFLFAYFLIVRTPEEALQPPVSKTVSGLMERNDRKGFEVDLPHR